MKINITNIYSYFDMIFKKIYRVLTKIKLSYSDNY